jgi:cystathionine beta-lyase
MVQEAGLALNDGRGFGPEGGGYMRMNIACPRATIERALGQLKAAVDRKMGR